MIVHTILYVSDQRRSSDLYRKLLNIEPSLDVPGMTEFKLSEKHILGLMPESGIKRLLGDRIPDPGMGNGIPRAELYFRVSEPDTFLSRAIELGLSELSSVQARDWGDRAGYAMDHDGHVLGFAKSISM